MRDPYEVLGVSHGAAAEVVRRAFKRAVRRNHPDVNPRDPCAADRLREVVAAYRQVERMRGRAESASPAGRIVVACQIRGADLYGVVDGDAWDQPTVALELRALDACGICGGLGYEEVAARFWRVERFECEVCKGGGIVRAERRVRVRLPVACVAREATPGTRIRLRGIGLACAGRPRGDAILFVKQAP